MLMKFVWCLVVWCCGESSSRVGVGGGVWGGKFRLVCGLCWLVGYFEFL